VETALTRRCILVNTNGMRLTEDFAAALIEYGVDLVNIAIDGATAETYESIRRYLKLDVVEANVRRFIDMRNASGKKRPYIMVNMIHMPENAHEAEAFLAKWQGIPDYAGLAGVVSRAGAASTFRSAAASGRAPRAFCSGGRCRS
jgi:MoaA/NifB/PqqE/SkfB family radical SAM enzyme